MAVYRTECKGRMWKWIEKGNRATLIVDETEQIWWGEVGDPRKVIPSDKVPLEVLLTFSVLRQSEA